MKSMNPALGIILFFVYVCMYVYGFTIMSCHYYHCFIQPNVLSYYMFVHEAIKLFEFEL